MKAACSCGAAVEFPAEYQGFIITCPKCRAALEAVEPAAPAPPPTVAVATTQPDAQAPTSAYAKRGGSFLGAGCLIQGLGLVCWLVAGLLFWTLIFPLVLFPLGLVLLLIGGRNAIWVECSACGGRLARASVQVCPHCRARILGRR